MPNNLEKIYKESKTKQILDFLFLPKETSQSKLLSLIDFFYVRYLSEIFLSLALIIVWYKSFFGNYLSFVNQPFLPLVLLFSAFIFAKKDKSNVKKSIIWYLVFLLVTLISALLALIKGANGSLLLLGWILFAQFGLTLFVAGLLQFKKLFLKLIVLLSIPMSGMGLYQFFTHVQTSSLWVSVAEKGTTRVFGFLGSPNVFGIMLAVITFLAFGIFLSEKNKLFLAISLINVFVIGLTLSRSAWVGLFAGIVAMIIIYRAKYIFFAPLTLLALIIPQIRKRIIVAFSPNYYFDSILDGRVWAWINGIHILKTHLFFGAGPGTYGGQLALNYASPVYLEGIQSGYTALYFTDNQFLEILVQTGIIGFFAFSGFIISVMVELISTFVRKNSKIALAVLGAFVCFVVASVFANNLEFTAVALPMALMLGAVDA